MRAAVRSAGRGEGRCSVTTARVGFTVGPYSVELPIRVASTANVREHHFARARRTKAQRQAVALFVKRSMLPSLPAVVTLTRIAPRLLDAHDNLRVALKPAADEIASIYGLPNDRDPRIAWEYAQEQRPKTYAVRIDVTPAEVKP
jgi:hypothetical protein